jgi:hypothetical protein
MKLFLSYDILYIYNIYKFSFVQKEHDEFVKKQQEITPADFLSYALSACQT